VLHRHEVAGDLTLALREGSIQLGVDHVRIGPGDHLREHRATDGADWRRPKLLVPSVCLARISVLPVLPILPVTNECGIIGTERVVHPRGRHLIDVLGVDEEGRLRRTIYRIARIARLGVVEERRLRRPLAPVVRLALLHEPLPAALSMLALVALVALVALLSVGTRGAVLSVTDDRGVFASEGVVDERIRDVVDVLGRAEERRVGRAIYRVDRIARLEEHIPDDLSRLADVAL